MQRAVNRFETGFERLYGVGLNEGMALCSLSRAGRLSSGELGELLGLSLSNASKVIASVERKGLVERVMGESDRRRMFFSLTDRGRALLESVDCSHPDLPSLPDGVC
jgi:DNA-binding MarR family transcriptional regulator